MASQKQLTLGPAFLTEPDTVAMENKKIKPFVSQSQNKDKTREALNYVFDARTKAVTQEGLALCKQLNINPDNLV